MQRRQLGRSDLMVPPLCFGGNVFGWTVDERTSFDLLDRLLASGLDFIDTADVYSTWVPGNQGGESEVILGNWMAARKNRSKVILATKGGSPMGPDRKGLKAGYITSAVEASLQRLQTDYIDLYQSHRDDLETPVEETLEAYARLVQAGKIRVIGASNFTPERLGAALDASEARHWPRYESLQPHYNLYERADFEAALQPLCVERQVGVIPYFSLASGFLTGKYRSEADLAQSKRGQGVAKYLTPRGHRILGALDEVAGALGATPAQVALAWLMARPSITSAIASATSTTQLDDIAEATRLELDAAAMAKLDQASAADAG